MYFHVFPYISFEDKFVFERTIEVPASSRNTAVQMWGNRLREIDSAILSPFGRRSIPGPSIMASQPTPP